METRWEWEGWGSAVGMEHRRWLTELVSACFGDGSGRFHEKANGGWGLVVVVSYSFLVRAIMG